MLHNLLINYKDREVFNSKNKDQRHFRKDDCLSDLNADNELNHLISQGAHEGRRREQLRNYIDEIYNGEVRYQVVTQQA